MAERVYVIEDDRVARETMAMLLRHGGFAPETFADAESAIDSLLHSGSRPAALVVDYRLPGRNGGELADWLAQHGELAGIPILMVTGSDAEDQSFRFSVVTTLRKPVENETLLDTLRKYVRPAA